MRMGFCTEMKDLFFRFGGSAARCVDYGGPWPGEVYLPDRSLPVGGAEARPEMRPVFVEDGYM